MGWKSKTNVCENEDEPQKQQKPNRNEGTGPGQSRENPFGEVVQKKLELKLTKRPLFLRNRSELHKLIREVVWLY